MSESQRIWPSVGDLVPGKEGAQVRDLVPGKEGAQVRIFTFTDLLKTVSECIPELLTVYLKGQSKEIFDRQFFSSFEPAWGH